MGALGVLLGQVGCLDLGLSDDEKKATEPDAAGINDASFAHDTAGGCTCVLAPPADWKGPLALSESSAAAPPSCGGSYPTAIAGGSRELVAPAAQCAPCSCGPASGSTCADTMKLVPYTAATCQGAACMANALTPSSQVCLTLTGVPTCTQSYQVTEPPVASGGSCTPSAAQTITIQPATFGQQAIGCAATSIGTAQCGQGAVCIPKLAAPFEPKPCISRTGDLDCPLAYPNKRVYYASYTDTRACSPCSCGAPNSQCDAQVAFFFDALCSAPMQAPESVKQNSCHASAYAWSVKTLVGAALEGACAPSGGPSGAATPVDPTTVCCQ